MSDTPRTDQFEKAYFAGLTTQFEDGFDFARELERENAALRAALIDAAEKCDAITDAAINAARKGKQ